ncbi:chorismate mutase [Streptomyces sp. NPDC055808]|uniref:chorismate mutase n=1 Tax=Streptomyces sp. NPDC001828 TaxID=3364615 RepID=UPI0036B7AE6A
MLNCPVSSGEFIRPVRPGLIGVGAGGTTRCSTPSAAELPVPGSVPGRSSRTSTALPHKESTMTLQTLPTSAQDTTQATIAELRGSIDVLDAEILGLLERRRELSQTVQRVRMAAGGRRTEFKRENVIIKRYADRFGLAGGAIAMKILEICRGSVAAGR